MRIDRSDLQTLLKDVKDKTKEAAEQLDAVQSALQQVDGDPFFGGSGADKIKEFLYSAAEPTVAEFASSLKAYAEDFSQVEAAFDDVDSADDAVVDTDRLEELSDQIDKLVDPVMTAIADANGAGDLANSVDGVCVRRVETDDITTGHTNLTHEFNSASNELIGWNAMYKDSAHYAKDRFRQIGDMLAQLKLQHKNGGMKSYDQDSMIGLSLQNAQSRYGTTLTQHDQEYTAEYWEETAEAATEAGKDVEDMLTTAEITNQIGQATLMIRNGTWYGSVLTDISHGSENKTWGMVKEETEETKLGKILDSAGKFILGFQIVTSISQGWTIYQVEKDKYGQGTALSDGAKVAVSGSVSAAAGYITSFLIEAPFVNVLGGVVIQERVDKGINQLWDGVTKGDWD